MSINRVFRGFAVLISSSVLTQLIGFVALAIVARRVGPEALGAYTFTLSLVTYVSLPITAGITNLGVRDIAREPGSARRVAGEVFDLQLVLAAVGYLGLVALAPLYAPDAQTRELVPIVGLFLFTGLSLEWALQGLQRMKLVAIARIAGQVAYGALVPFVVTGGFEGVRLYAWLMIGGLFVKALITVVAFKRVAGFPEVRVRLDRLRGRFRASRAIGYATVMGQVYAQIDLVMLGYLGTTADVGQYGVAYRIPFAIFTLATAWLTAIFPHASALAASDHSRLRRHIGAFVTLTGFVVLPLIVCTPFVAEGVITAFFGAQYAPAGTPFALLTAATAISLIGANLGSAVLGLRGDRYFARMVTLAAVLNVALNFALIPAYGMIGAAVNTIISEAIVTGLLALRVRHQLGGVDVDWARIQRAVAALVPAVAALLLLRDLLPAVALAVLAGAIYAAGLLLFRAVRLSEVRSLLGPEAEARDVAEVPAG